MYSGRHWLTILLAGGTTAFAFILALTGSVGGMFLSNFTQLPLFLAGLSLGMTGSIAATAVAAGVLLIAGASIGIPLLLVLYAAPTIILTRQALLSRPDGQGGQEWYPPGLLLLWATGMAAVLAKPTDESSEGSTKRRPAERDVEDTRWFTEDLNQ